MNDNVVQIFELVKVSVPKLMRDLADAIAAETMEEDQTEAVVLIRLKQSGDTEVYPWGKTDTVRTLGMFQLGIHTVTMNQYEEPDE